MTTRTLTEHLGLLVDHFFTFQAKINKKKRKPGVKSGLKIKLKNAANYEKCLLTATHVLRNGPRQGSRQRLPSVRNVSLYINNVYALFLKKS